MHEFHYPVVREIKINRQSSGPENTMHPVELGPRLIQHNEQQVDYYTRQLAAVSKELARVILIYSNQLQFDFELGDGV